MSGSSGSSGSSTTARRHPSKPVTAKDKALTKKHLRESVSFNMKHAKEHIAAAKADRRALGKARSSRTSIGQSPRGTTGNGRTARKGR